MDSGQEKNFGVAWAEKLAQEVVPDEIDRVPFIFVGFVKGENTRKKLLQQSKGNALGGFGADGVILFPWILQALSVATPFLGGLLASRTYASCLVIINEIKGVLAAHKQSPQEHMQLGISDTLAQQSVVSLAQTLRIAGLSVDKSEILARELLIFLLQDPTNAVLFLQKITEHK